MKTTIATLPARLRKTKDAKKEKCSGCNKNAAESLHSCPYQQDINDSTDDKYCNCCGDCRYECCMEI